MGLAFMQTATTSIVIKLATTVAHAASNRQVSLIRSLIALTAVFVAGWLTHHFPDQWFWIASPLAAWAAYTTRLAPGHTAGPPLTSTLQAPDKLPLIGQVIPIWQRLIDHAKQHSESHSEDMLRVFNSLLAKLHQVPSPDSVQLNSVDPTAQDEIDQVLVGFQAQDRLSQMLDNVSQDMSKMEAWLKEEGNVDEKQVNEWLERLYASYTMEEQRSQHIGKAVIQRESAIEFF